MVLGLISYKLKSKKYKSRADEIKFIRSAFLSYVYIEKYFLLILLVEMIKNVQNIVSDNLESRLRI